jgi:hypothetical protein
MRAIFLLFAVAWSASAQFKSTVPLVVAPTTVTDSKGHYVDGLEPEDLILYDNNVPQKIQMDWMTFPIDLVLAVETGENRISPATPIASATRYACCERRAGRRRSWTRCMRPSRCWSIVRQDDAASS